MQYPVLDLLGTSLIPELCPDIPAGPARHEHLVLILITAIRAFPDQLPCLIFPDDDLSVIAAAFTEIALRVQLRVHNILIDKLHHRQDRRNIVLHIRHLNITDRTARRQLLEVRLELQLLKCINLL